MHVLVDTSVWSLAFRRKASDLNLRERMLVGELSELVKDGRARIIGVVRQELLSGVRIPVRFEELREVLSSFPDEPVSTDHHEEAAKASNDCQAKGIASSVVDMLICAVAHRHGMSIFTTDPDFEKYSRVLSLKLHRVSGGKTIP